MRNIILLGMGLCGMLWMRAAEPEMNHFSEMERNHIRVATPGLFSDGNRFEIHLENLPDSAFWFPLQGGKLISAYGTRGGHTGSDIKTCANDTIRAVFDGVVRMAKRYAAYGNVVVLRHSNGLETIYSHNSKNLVKVGDRVKAGQGIALTGRTGRATTEHLHFEVRVNGQHFNPKILFDMQTREPLKRTLVCTKSGSRVKLTPKTTTNK
ncbi:M23 family metallopeptidase [uncultured Bacteroides sp.]|uniref:M23 family metallopeptidase n=1 Tax=uncultured Bacteroides sp. TaxID=162156 RepID=UPI002603F911|nr:M23 family metallopeptidase [uncultured Bacteroides sp.]